MLGNYTKGFVELQVPESYNEDYDKQDIYLDESLEEECDCLYQNQFIMLASDADPKKTALGFLNLMQNQSRSSWI